MKIADYISKSIQEYPLMYKDVDYEKSKLKVLNHIFFTNGNGLEMAETENPEDGGYVVHPKHKKDKFGDWERIKDKPYCAVKYKKIPDGYFKSVVYYVYGSGRPLETIHRKDDCGGSNTLFRYEKTDKEYQKPSLYEAESRSNFSPYPLSKGYALGCDGFYGGQFLQDDWMAELVILCERTLEYFNNHEYLDHVYYPSDGRVGNDLRAFNEKFEKSGIKGVNELRKIWGYEPKETPVDRDEVLEQKKKSWEKFKNEQFDFLTKFLKKYKK